MKIEDLRILLQQEWENYRYQDKLRWSRVQTVGLIEAALFTGAYSNFSTLSNDTHGFKRFVFAVFMAALAAVFCALAEKDGRDANVCAARAESIEKDLELGPRMRAEWVLGIRGHHTLRAAMVLILILNFIVLCDLIRSPAMDLICGEPSAKISTLSQGQRFTFEQLHQ